MIRVINFAPLLCVIGEGKDGGKRPPSAAGSPFEAVAALRNFLT